MKYITVVLSLFMVLSGFSVPVYAMGMLGGMGGSGMIGGLGSRLLDWFQKGRNGSADADPSGRGSRRMERLNQEHEEDSEYLKYQIRMKEKELDALLSSSDPDLEKVRDLRGDIQELRAEADREQRRYESQADRMNSGGYGLEGHSGRRADGPGERSGTGGMGYNGGMR